jgi:DNA polymerase-3 subunit epsilon
VFPYPAGMQRSFDDMGTPLCDVTFVVVDLETTGGSPATCAITEVGAIKLKGGECLGTFQTLVNPGCAIPPEITYLTGITQAMVIPAPRIDEVLPALLEFMGDAVLVGHNVRFDVSFLNAAAQARGRDRLHHTIVDTCALARRLIRDEVPNCKLGTLARHFRTARQPTHRALDDAVATGEVLHCLLERAGTMGVLALDDLVALPKVQGHPQVAKLKLAADLPRKPGVYIFRDAGARPLYVGKAVDLRRRVRSYFTGDDRRKVGRLLRETQRIDHIVCAGELEAAVLEVRLIHELRPRYNRQSKLWSKYAYLKLTLDERFPRLSVVRVPKPGDGCLYLGPLSSVGTARLVAEAIEEAVPIRRCTAKPSARSPRAAPCLPAQLGVASCPCAGAMTDTEYGAIVERVVRGLTVAPDDLLEPLGRKMRALAADHRFEEAADVRNRAAALARALARQRRLDGLRWAGRLALEVDGGGAVVEHGRLVATWSDNGAVPPASLLDAVGPVEGPLPKELADELSCVAAYLEQRAARVRLVSCDGTLAWPLPRLPSFEPVG